MPSTIGTLLNDALQVKNETGAGLNTAIRIGTLFLNLLKLLPFEFDPNQQYTAGQQIIFNGRLYRCFQDADFGEGPEDAPGKWQDSATNSVDEINDAANKLTRATDVQAYVTAIVHNAITAPGKLNLNPADENTPGIAPRASLAKILAATDNTAFVTSSGLAYALAEALRGLENYGWNDSTEVDPTSDHELTVSNRLNANVLRLITALEVIDRAKVQYVLTQAADGTIAKTPIGATVAMSIGALYNATTHILTLAAQNAIGDVSYTIPELNILASKATEYTVPAELRGGGATLHVTGKTATQTADTTADIPADPLGNFYILAAYVARNTGIDNVGSISHFVKAKGPGIYYTVTGLNGTVVPSGIAGAKRSMTNEAGGYQRPGLFTGTANFAGLDVGITNGSYRVTYEMKDHPEIGLTFDYTISDAQPNRVLYQSALTPPETVPTAPTVDVVKLTIGKDFSITLPAFIDAPDGCTYGLNYRPNGTMFNSTSRVFSGNVPILSAIEIEVEYYCTTPLGKVNDTHFHLSVIDATVTPALAQIFAVDMNQTATGTTNNVTQYTQTYIFKTSNNDIPEYRLKIDGFGNFGAWHDANSFDYGDGYKWFTLLIGTGNLAVSIEVRPKTNATDAATVKLTFPAGLGAAKGRVNYYNVLSAGGGSSSRLDAKLGIQPTLTGAIMKGYEGDPSRLNLRATINADGKVELHNDANPVSDSGFFIYLANSVGSSSNKAGATDITQTGTFERGIPINVLQIEIKNGTPPELYTNQNYQLNRPSESSITVY